MYSGEFCKIYDQYGWDYFSLTMGKAILQYLKANNKNVKNHLDLGCGVGTLCDYFYKNKIETTGVDISSDMINICKNKNKNIEFIVNDFTQYISSKKYDLITLTCDTLNHILENSKLENLFSNIYEMLNEEGYLVFDIYDKNKLSLNCDIISNRENEINVYYYITNKENFVINTNVKVKQKNRLIYEYDVLEKLYDIEYIKSLLIKYKLNLIQAKNSIFGEKQRFEDKIYIICRKQSSTII